MLDTRKHILIGLAVAIALTIGGCSRQPEPAKEAAKEAPKEAPAAEPPKEAPKEAPPPETAKKAEPAKKAEAKKETLGATAPVTFNVKFATTAGDFTVTVHKDWAPIGAQRFYDLVKSGYFSDTGFFRVVPNFVVQFGLAADPAITKKWDKTLKDDPVTKTNKLGSLVFATAGPNTRTTQLFINLKSNQFLDTQGFSPFGEITEGMETVQKIYPGYGEQPDQGAITAQGNAYLKAKFPNLTFIKTAKIM